MADLNASLQSPLRQNARLLARFEPLEGSPDEELDAFWSALPVARLSGRLLQLADGASYLSPLTDKLYVREDYVGMWEELKNSLDDAGVRRFVITGTPGVGKSMFGLFVLYQLARLDSCKTVVWEAPQSRRRYLFRRGQRALKGGLNAFASFLDDESVWYLVNDPSEYTPPMIVNAVTVVLSSPARRNYRHILNSVGATIRYMPPWNWEEVEECRELLFAGDATRSADIVKNAFDRWGGVPRHVFDKVGDVAWHNFHVPPISLVKNVHDLVRVDQVAAPEEARHRMLHMHSERPYCRYSFVLGSSFIAESLYTKFSSDQRVLAESLSSGDPALANICSQLFETHCHRVLAKGGEFEVRCLRDGGDESKVTLQPSVPGYFSNDEELGILLDGGCRDYLLPRGANHPAVDAICAGSRLLLQVAASASHGVDVPGLDELIKRLDSSMGRTASYDLVFVVPSDMYKGFGPQRLEFPNGKAYGDFASTLDRVSQKVLKLPSLPGLAPPAQMSSRRTIMGRARNVSRQRQQSSSSALGLFTGARRVVFT